ncbi:UDP-N-acetylmuramoyl-tripeptide--D-alanyl-D-alanine ligase [bacterium BMS3Abin02]|nr:UDP-N-acetylmuramoyl-tripeptide--D-alanyl-D-alanine ligase [bacterium BMS3Abin02]
MIDILTSAAAIAASGLSMLRWVRVAQREHYLPGSVVRFAVRWWGSRIVNLAGFVLAVAGAIVSIWVRPVGLVTAAIIAFGPLGLGVRGRTAPLAWTPRLRRTVGAAAALLFLLLAVGGAGVVAVMVAPAIPLLVDAALWLLWPVEVRSSTRFVDEASRRLASVAPTVVAITGSFGKTTTKAHVGRLLRNRRRVVVSPASFNNRLGLARSINEQLTPGTEVFVAEMGTYGRGEIRALCEWIRPTVSVITAIGPVHLERFGTLEAVASAKAEIVDGSQTLVLNIDHPQLAELADAEEGRREVIRCSSSSARADVYVGPDSMVYLRGQAIGATSDGEAFPGNVACAVGVLAAIGLTADPADLASLERPAHRRQVATAQSGAVVIDDTYNANPVGARAALSMLGRYASPGARRVVVTPGLVELGRRQFAENVALAEHAAREATDIVIVGRTNRRALLEGSRGAMSVRVVDSREEAVAWVRRTLGPGDAVVYENDLPDHYP